MSCRIDTLLFKKTLIVFWTAWWLIALWTDVVGGLSHLGYLHATWAPDANYPYLVETLKMYQPPVWLAPLFFSCIVIGLSVSSGAFVWACFGLRAAPSVWMRRASIAFILSLTLWLGFFIADQLIMKFELEENHMVQGGFQLLCFLALYLLPSENGSR